MTIKVSKPAINIREELADLKQDTGLKGQELMRADTAQEARTAIGAGRKNLIINGGMQIDQRGTLGSPNTSASTAYVKSVDGCWFCVEQTNGQISYEQVADAPTGTGLTHSQKVTVTTADTSLASNQRLCPTQGIEGYNWNRMEWGTAGAKTIAVQFWVKSSVVGTYGFTIRTGSAGMSYTQPYTINSANTWEKKTFTIAGPTSILGGAITATNGCALYLIFGLGFGSDFDTGVDTTWTAVGNGQGRTAQTNLIATNGATWQLTGFQIEEGSTHTDFEHRSYGEELALCQRYFVRFDGNTEHIGHNYNGSNIDINIALPVYMRATPTLFCADKNDLSNTASVYSGGYNHGISASISAGRSVGNQTMIRITGTLDPAGATNDCVQVQFNDLQFKAEL